MAAGVRLSPALLLALLGLGELSERGCALYFPSVAVSQKWQAPLLQPWDPLRATYTSVTVSWTPAWNPHCETARYELAARRPDGSPSAFSDLEPLQFGEMQTEDEMWPGDAAWRPWKVVYTGLGRAYTLGVAPGTGHAAQFRVRACGPEAADSTDKIVRGCSAWSSFQTTHSVLSGALDKVNVYIRGTGKNAPNYTEIWVNRQVIYRRRDETGLVLAIFSRLDLSLKWLKTYDTHRSRNQSLQMSKAIRQFNASFFVVVVSSIAWEWHAGRTLARTMEFCGAYYFGQWAHVFAEQAHYPSPVSDIQQASSQDEFGHPYAFIGIPGIGMAMGWESLMYNSGYYIAANVNVPKAIIRTVAYYDYVARQYRLTDTSVVKAGFYFKGQPPAAETLHNPRPTSKTTQSNEFVLVPPMSAYQPYVGTLARHIVTIMEANNTVPPYNYAFLLFTIGKLTKVDPRPKSMWITEIERVWGAPSARYNPRAFNVSVLPGQLLGERKCSNYIYYGYLESSPEVCGEDMSNPLCCPEIDTPGFLAVACNVGVSPTICRNTTKIALPTNTFTVIAPPYVPDHWSHTSLLDAIPL